MSVSVSLCLVVVVVVVVVWGGSGNSDFQNKTKVTSLYVLITKKMFFLDFSISQRGPPLRGPRTAFKAYRV